LKKASIENVHARHYGTQERTGVPKLVVTTLLAFASFSTLASLLPGCLLTTCLIDCSRPCRALLVCCLSFPLPVNTWKPAIYDAETPREYKPHPQVPDFRTIAPPSYSVSSSQQTIVTCLQHCVPEVLMKLKKMPSPNVVSVWERRQENFFVVGSSMVLRSV